MKIIIKLTIIIGIVLMLCSCSTEYDITYEFDGCGQVAVISGERIYYVSDENGESGIYSMSFDGTNVDKKISNRSITNLQFYENALYYAGLFKVNDDPGFWRPPSYVKNQHTLYYFNSIDKKYPLKLSSVNIYDNVVNFYVSKNGYSVISYGSFEEELCLYDNSSKFVSRKDLNATKRAISFDYDGQIIQKDIYEFGDLLFISENFPLENDYDKFASNLYPTVLDTNTGSKVLGYSENRHSDFKVYFMDDEYIYCSYKDLIVVVNKESYEVIKTFKPNELSDSYSISYLSDCGEHIYIIAEHRKENGRKIAEKLFMMISSTFETSLVLDVGRKEQIAGINEGYLVLINNSKITKVSLDKGKVGGEPTELAEIPKRTRLKFDYAGDWLFVYKYSSELPELDLLMKINLQTGESINVAA